MSLKDRNISLRLDDETFHKLSEISKEKNKTNSEVSENFISSI